MTQCWGLGSLTAVFVLVIHAAAPFKGWGKGVQCNGTEKLRARGYFLVECPGFATLGRRGQDT